MKKRISLFLVLALLLSMVNLPATAKGERPSTDAAFRNEVGSTVPEHRLNDAATPSNQTTDLYYNLDQMSVNENTLNYYVRNYRYDSEITIQTGDKMYILGWAAKNGINVDRIVWTLDGVEKECSDDYRERTDVARVYGIDPEYVQKSGFGLDENMMEMLGVDELEAGIYSVSIKVIFESGEWGYIKEGITLFVCSDYFTEEWSFISEKSNACINLKQAGDFAAAVFEADVPFTAIRIPKYWTSSNPKTVQLDLFNFDENFDNSINATPVAHMEFSAKANSGDGVYALFPEVDAGVYVIRIKLNSIEGSGYFVLPGEGNSQKAEYHTTDGEKTFNFGIKTIYPEQAFGAYIGVSIPDEAFRNYVFSNIDTDGNYILSEEEKAAVSSLELDGLNISSLKGVELFENLRSLTCSGNNLNEIDLSGMWLLEYLDCRGNNIATLDVSACQNLLDVFINGTRSEDAESVSYVLGSFGLIIDKTTVIRTGYPQYDVIVISETNFPDANFREYVRVFDLDGDGVFVWDELEAVTEIVADELEIESLDGIEHFSNLTSLSIAGNSLTELDINSFGNLTYLDCSGNLFESFDVSSHFGFAEAVAYGTRTVVDEKVTYEKDGFILITDIDISLYTGIPYYDNRIIINEINFPDAYFREYVKVFDLNDDGVLEWDELDAVTEIVADGLGIESLDGIEFFVNLTSLSVAGNNLTAFDIYAFLNLTYLDCSGNLFDNLDVSGHAGFAEAVERGSCTATEENVTYEKDGFVLVTDVNVAIYTGYPQYYRVIIDDINFPDYNFREYVKAFDFDFDDELVQEELDYVTDIGVDGFEIESLKGIEFFTQLRVLACNSNQIEELDLSNNLLLEELYCDNNQLTKLDLSNNLMLKVLSCGNNQLTELNLSNNSLLERLYCWDNQLTELNVSNNSSLRVLNCPNNPLAELDITNNVMLEDIYVVNTLLSGLDISENAYIRDLYLNGVYINIDCLVFTGVEVNEQNFPNEIFRNYILSSFDINGSAILNQKELDAVEVIDFLDAGISSLEGINYFNKVVSLRVSGNPIDTLNLAGMDRLSVLGCQDTNVDELDISDCPHLLDAYLNGIVSADSMGYITYDSEFGYMIIDETIDIIMGIPVDAEHFPDDNFRAYILNGIDSNRDGYLGQTERKTVTNISIVGMNVASLEGLSYFDNVTMLNCVGNQLTSLDLSSLTKLIGLYIDGNLISEIDLSHNTELNYFQCEGNQLSSLDVSSNTKLYTLYCSYNSLSELDLSYNTELDSLGCSYNELTSLDLSANTNLNQLICNNNSISRLDLSNNTGLNYLECYGNSMEKLVILNCETLINAVVEGSKSSTDAYDCYNGGRATLYVDKDLKISTGKEPAIVYSLTSTLNGTVGMNVYLVLPDFIIEDPGAYVQFSKDGNEKTVMVADVLDSPSIKDGVVRYVFSYEVVAKEFRDIVNVKLFDSTGRSIQLVTRLGVDYGTDGYPYPLSRYLLERISSDESTQKMKNLARAMLDYGSAAQLYFNYHVDDSILVTDAVSSIQYSEFDTYESIKSDDADKPDGFVKNTFSLVLEGDTALKMYYNFNAGYDPFVYQYYIDGEEATLYKEGTKYYLIVEDIVAKELDVAHEFTISDGTKSYTIISSALSYARYLAGLSDTNKQNLGKAILVYNRMAKEYFNDQSN